MQTENRFLMQPKIGAGFLTRCVDNMTEDIAKNHIASFRSEPTRELYHRVYVHMKRVNHEVEVVAIY